MNNLCFFLAPSAAPEAELSNDPGESDESLLHRVVKNDHDVDVNVVTYEPIHD